MPAVPATTCLVACAALPLGAPRGCSAAILWRNRYVRICSATEATAAIPVLIPRFCAPLPPPLLTLPPLPLPLNLQPPLQQNPPLLHNLHPYRNCLGQSAGDDDICAPRAAAGYSHEKAAS